MIMMMALKRVWSMSMSTMWYQTEEPPLREMSNRNKGEQMRSPDAILVTIKTATKEAQSLLTQE
jgi:hypothetical protein